MHTLCLGKNSFNEIPRQFFISRLFQDRGGQVHLQAPCGRYKAVLVVFVLVVNAGEKTLTFSYGNVSLHVIKSLVEKTL